MAPIFLILYYFFYCFLLFLFFQSTRALELYLTLVFINFFLFLFYKLAILDYKWNQIMCSDAIKSFQKSTTVARCGLISARIFSHTYIFEQKFNQHFLFVCPISIACFVALDIRVCYEIKFNLKVSKYFRSFSLPLEK